MVTFYYLKIFFGVAESAGKEYLSKLLSIFLNCLWIFETQVDFFLVSFSYSNLSHLKEIYYVNFDDFCLYIISSYS